MTDATTGTTSRNGWTIGLWVAQIILALFFGSAAIMKLTTPIAALGQQMAWVNSSPAWLITFIGIMEILGALGMILPSLTRILPSLTPLAAAGFSIIQILAMGVHISLGEYATLPINVIALALALFVAWGRFRKAPISPH
ncbi:DoxX family protein [Devosia sp.]|uniref:DoxX family protein n=1 Tax=Devosia sp. TaxID=1871048 RepID=UPI0032679780